MLKLYGRRRSTKGSDKDSLPLSSTVDAQDEVSNGLLSYFLLLCKIILGGKSRISLFQTCISCHCLLSLNSHVRAILLGDLRPAALFSHCPETDLFLCKPACPAPVSIRHFSGICRRPLLRFFSWPGPSANVRGGKPSLATNNCRFDMDWTLIIRGGPTWTEEQADPFSFHLKSSTEIYVSWFYGPLSIPQLVSVRPERIRLLALANSHNGRSLNIY